jgi:hypothetical protein
VHAHVQRLVSVVKMATVLEEYNNEEQRSIVLKDSMQRIFIKQSPVYGGKYLLRKAFTAGSRNSLKTFERCR